MSFNALFNLDKLLNLINVGIFVLDANDKIVFWNNWLYLQTGIEQNKAIGKRIEEVFSLPYEKSTTFNRLVKTALKLDTPTFFTADGGGYMFPIELKKTSKQSFEYMQQDVTIIPYEPNDRLVTVVIYDQTTLMSNKEIIFIQSNYDALTALPNRTMLFEKMDLAIYNASRKGKPFALFYVDVDHFKHINDTYGHDIGDEVLKYIASVLLSGIRKTDTASRLGGDEFIVLVNELENHNHARLVAEHLIQKVNRSITVGESEITPSISLGIAYYDAEEANDINTIMKNADIALYNAKQGGRNNFTIFEKNNT